MSHTVLSAKLNIRIRKLCNLSWNCECYTIVCSWQNSCPCFASLQCPNESIKYKGTLREHAYLKGEFTRKLRRVHVHVMYSKNLLVQAGWYEEKCPKRIPVRPEYTVLAGCSLSVVLCFRTSQYGRAHAADDPPERHGTTRAPGTGPDDLLEYLRSIGCDWCSVLWMRTFGIHVFRVMEVGWDHHWMPWLVPECPAWTCEWTWYNLTTRSVHDRPTFLSLTQRNNIKCKLPYFLPTIEALSCFTSVALLTTWLYVRGSSFVLFFITCCSHWLSLSLATD